MLTMTLGILLCYAGSRVSYDEKLKISDLLTYEMVNNKAANWCIVEAGTVPPKTAATEHENSTVRRLRHV